MIFVPLTIAGVVTVVAVAAIVSQIIDRRHKVKMERLRQQHELDKSIVESGDE